jgi:hypothetical protein
MVISESQFLVLAHDFVPRHPDQSERPLLSNEALLN